MQQIKKRYSEEVIHEHGETIAECVQHAREIGADLTEANLTEANLTRANLAKANLAKANLAEADLTRANLAKANLAWANLTRANLTEANLTRANLTEANLAEANLTEANIENTSFKHADMRFCDRDDNAKLAHLNVCEWPVSIQFDGVHIGCKTFTLEEIMNMTEEIAATHSDKAPIRWRRWGKAIQALAKATLEG